MGTKVSYPEEVKSKATEMRLAGVPVKEVMEKLIIRNYRAENLDAMVSEW